MTNYNKSYKCTGCKAKGVKLWRDYQTCASAVELKCATCLTPKQVKEDASYSCDSLRALDDDGVFAFRNGDQLGGLVPAVTTEDGDTFWGYSSVPTDRVIWWHSMPTYQHETLERRCLVNLLTRAVADMNYWPDSIARLADEIAPMASELGIEFKQPSRCRRVTPGVDGDIIELRSALTGVYKKTEVACQEWRRLSDLAMDLRWKLERTVFRVTEIRNVNIWGSVTEPCGDGMVVRYGKELTRTLQPGDRFAVHRGKAVLLLGETFHECPSIMDCEQDGKRFAALMMKNNYAVMT